MTVRGIGERLCFVIVAALAGCGGQSTSQNASPPAKSASGGAAARAGAGGSLGNGGRRGDGGAAISGATGSDAGGQRGAGGAAGGGGTGNDGSAGEVDNAGSSPVAGSSGTPSGAGGVGAAGTGGRFDAGGTLSSGGRRSNAGGAGNASGAAGASGVAGATAQASCPMTLEERCAEDGLHCVSLLSAAEVDPAFCTPSAGEWTCGSYQAVIPTSIDASVVYYYDESGTLIAIGRAGGVSGAVCLGGPPSIALTASCSGYLLLPSCDS